ncbi:hypothetical protein [Marinobacter sp. ELB17]|uniref:hypothetical protein n=1 Tax=Marinobacter sp. ELB17 TaxID=270374 RepID=UPI0005620C2F|nr:hypothetical protein [Marinobacter sp. ELB17]
MYNPDDIQQALADMREQQSSSADYNEAADVQRFYTDNDPEREMPVSEIHREHKAAIGGPMPNSLIEAGVVYVRKHEETYTDVDGDKAHSATYRVADNQDELAKLYILACSASESRLRCQPRIVEHVDFNVDEPVSLPVNAHLEHEFRDGAKLYTHARGVVVEFEGSFYTGTVSPMTRELGPISMVVAAMEAITKDKAIKASIAAGCQFNRLVVEQIR